MIMASSQETKDGVIWRLAWPIEGQWHEVSIDDLEGSIYLKFGQMNGGKVTLPVDCPQTAQKLGGMIESFGKSRIKKKINVRFE